MSEADGLEAGQRVVLAVRPERAELTSHGQGMLSGTLANIVYFGTDTNYHLVLPGCGDFQIRSQNRQGAGARFRPGDAVDVRISPDAIRVLVH